MSKAGEASSKLCNLNVFQTGSEAKPPAAGLLFGKKALLIRLDTFRTRSEPFERTTFLTYESQLKN